MTDVGYAYRDELPPGLGDVWDETRAAARDEDPPEMVLAGVGREAIVVTRERVYGLRRGLWGLIGDAETTRVENLADLARTGVREGLLFHRLELSFGEGSSIGLRGRAGDRDKLRLAARIVAALAVSAEARREERVRRTARAEAAAGRGPTETPGATANPRVGDGGLNPPTPLGPRPAAFGGANAAHLGGPQDTLELLKGLWQLVEVGALTAAEYQAKKAELLARL
jgi:hypothetical protein